MPVFLLALPGGALADIVDRRRVPDRHPALTMLAAAALAILTLRHATTAWSLLAFTFADRRRLRADRAGLERLGARNSCRARTWCRRSR